MGHKSPKLKRITVPRRILLLLYDNQKYVDSFEVSESVSQMGIATELNLRQNHVSRALIELISEGLIFTRTSHIKGGTRRKSVYFLSQKGAIEVQEYIEDLSLRTILFHTSDDELKESTLAEAAEKLRKILGHTPSYHKILTKYFNGIEIDVKLVDKSTKAVKKTKSKLNLPVIRHFYGRAKENKKVLQSISKNKYKFIIITSIAGQGKTAFLANIASNIKGRPIFWLSLTEWSQPSILFNDWATGLKEHGKMNLFNYLGSSAQFNLQNALKMFVKDSTDLKPIFVIDDFHKAAFEVKKIFPTLKTLLSEADNTTFLVSSRTRPEFYNRRDILVSKTILELDLEGLDKDSASAILRNKGIPETEFDHAYDLTNGHPLALELYSPTLFIDENRSNLEFNAFLGEEVIKDLNEPELEVVKLASIFQRPATNIAFFFKPEINQEVLDRLCKKLVLRAYNNGTYDIHDLIKSYFLDRMTDYEKQEYISIACDHYSSSGSEKDLLDYLRLLSESQQRKRFIRAVLENADFLLSQGYSQVGEYIQDIDEAEVSKLDYVRLLILKCDAALANGKHQLARRFLKKGLASYDSLLQTKLKEKTKEELILLVSRIYNRSAEISKLEGRLDETIKEHKKSIQLNKKYNNKPGEGKALNNLALAYRERGELDLALDTLMKAQKIFQELNDKTALALVEVNIGDIYLLKRDLKAAMNHFQQAENASLKYPATRGLIFNKIGKAQVQLGHFDLAQNAYFVSLKAYKEANDQTNRIRTLSELFKCALNLKNREAAQNYLEATLRLLEDRFRPPEPSDSSELTLKNTLFSRHMKDRLIFSSIWDKKELKTNLKEYVNFQLNNNDPKAILEDLDYLLKELDTQKRALLILCADLERSFWKMPDKHPAIIVGLHRTNLLVQLKRKKEAKTHAKKLYPEAKRLKFGKAMRRINELLR